ncbi:uncharacterized protein BO66DRAFT_403731 [Aspergillus aculeatinus CBS 121060]|uniref:Uncharacterized protein n=2 Tax=Aspergillus subgen. Circumdati TaxID=2720871 RepID=A0ACD1H1W3_9EURO|nr:hypothetical protein BO95DRAFT_441531 [Aspergillus brunneoviolaceus CBS 621.78]XP_025501357.1 hypothetical protein BO66DRAFT_403731 [Aspergillus aculeatinus CBS 121060]RAH47081.1 hypothetical protein BO95DRAFT_441531 [Aspergillus brunneoviolaceus CBS 621.78]RAH67534.1 hypothetical protein BO66DRAFT_403731 [Aspergillus aculeatinus CBS 121060]
MDEQRWATATTTSVTVLAFLCVVLRIVSRLERKQKLWWDDWMIIFSMGWNFVVVGFIYAMIHEGMGIHADQLPTGQVILIAKFLVVAEILYVFNLVWTKLSILLMYYRIFRFAYFKRWAYIIGTFVICWVICITFLFIFICVPVQKLWYPSLPGHCISQVGTWIANATSTIATDLVILFLPLPQVWKLQLRLSEKVALTIAFGLGFFVVFASAYRFSVLFSYTAADSSYTLAPTVGWTAIEMSAGIVSACLPTIRPALQLAARTMGIQAVMPAIFRSTGHSANHLSSKSEATQLGSRFAAGDIPLSTGGGGGGGDGGTSSSRPVVRHSFYHLPDEGELSEIDSVPLKMEVSLRPKHDRGQTVTKIRGRTSVASGEDDLLPLHGIRVQKDFRQDG